MDKIAILGLGCSLSEYDPKEFDFSIGVNDVWRYHKVNALVCLNNAKEFTPDRLKVINESTPDVFYSQLVAWDVRKDFKKINLLTYYPDQICNIDLPAFNKSYTSVFVAAQIGFKFYNATELHIFGCDLTNHPHLDSVYCAKIKLHFTNLKAALLAKDCKLIVHGSGILKDI